MPLDMSQIEELYAKKRTKFLYENTLHFIMTETDEPGFDVKADFPVEFGKKNASTLYQGFRNAAEKLEVADQVDIVNREGNVYILIKSRVEALAA